MFGADGLTRCCSTVTLLQMVEISQLQARLSQNLAQQAESLERIFSNTSEAGENVTLANQHIKQAMRDSNDLRWGVFFFLIMCAFSLLFLHWYGGGYSRR